MRELCPSALFEAKHSVHFVVVEAPEVSKFFSVMIELDGTEIAFYNQSNVRKF